MSTHLVEGHGVQGVENEVFQVEGFLGVAAASVHQVELGQEVDHGPHPAQVLTHRLQQVQHVLVATTSRGGVVVRYIWQ